MNYLRDKKTNKNRPIKIMVAIVVVIILFLFRSWMFDGFSYVSTSIFRPLLSSGGSIRVKLRSLGAYLSSKSSLYNENVSLKAEIEASATDRANYASVVKENSDLKELLGRRIEAHNKTLATILAKPNQSPYDTLLIDIGSDAGVVVGNKVFAFGNIPIGRIAEVYPHTSKVVLYSTSGEKTQVIISGKPASPNTSQGGNIFAELVGRGGNNFEMVLPRDMILLKEDQVVLPGITPHVVGVVKTIISDQREAFQKALLVAPVNIQSLKFVEVER